MFRVILPWKPSAEQVFYNWKISFWSLVNIKNFQGQQHSFKVSSSAVVACLKNLQLSLNWLRTQVVFILAPDTISTVRQFSCHVSNYFPLLDQKQYTVVYESLSTAWNMLTNFTVFFLTLWTQTITYSFHYKHLPK